MKITKPILLAGIAAVFCLGIAGDVFADATAIKDNNGCYTYTVAQCRSGDAYGRNEDGGQYGSCPDSSESQAECTGNEGGSGAQAYAWAGQGLSKAHAKSEATDGYASAGKQIAPMSAGTDTLQLTLTDNTSSVTVELNGTMGTSANARAYVRLHIWQNNSRDDTLFYGYLAINGYVGEDSVVVTGFSGTDYSISSPALDSLAASLTMNRQFGYTGSYSDIGYELYVDAETGFYPKRVPALTPIGLAVLLIALLGVGVFTYRRRSLRA